MDRRATLRDVAEKAGVTTATVSYILNEKKSFPDETRQRVMSAIAELEQFLIKLFEPFDKEKLDAVVLGCTHYPFVSRELKKILGGSVRLFDGGPGTARETKRRLANAGLLNPGQTRGTIQFDNSSPSKEKQELCMKLLDAPMEED